MPLARLLIEQGGLSNVDMMGHEQYINVFRSRTILDQIMSLDSAGLHPLFMNHSDFDLPEMDPLIELFRRYDLVVSFLYDERGNFEKNLIYTLCTTHPAEVITLNLRPPDYYSRHTSEYFMEQFIEQSHQMYLRVQPQYLQEPLLKMSSRDGDTGRGILQEAGLDLARRIIAIHPGSGSEQKCWPMENFLELAKKLTQKEFQPLFLLGPAERERWKMEDIEKIRQKYYSLKQITLEETACILTCCDGFIGNDSGITHLAGGLGLTTLAIFGPSKSNNWRPLGKYSEICLSEQTEKSIWPSPESVYAKWFQLFA
jgi:ADP-heptose:LPS heptosyltransferase